MCGACACTCHVRNAHVHNMCEHMSGHVRAHVMCGMHMCVDMCVCVCVCVRAAGNAWRSGMPRGNARRSILAFMRSVLAFLRGVLQVAFLRGVLAFMAFRAFRAFRSQVGVLAWRFVEHISTHQYSSLHINTHQYTPDLACAASCAASRVQNPLSYMIVVTFFAIVCTCCGGGVDVLWMWSGGVVDVLWRCCGVL